MLLYPTCQLKLLVKIALASVFFQVVEGRKKSIASLDEFWTFITVVYSLVFFPVLLYFVFSVLRDPAVGELAQLVWKSAKGRTLNFLSSDRNIAVQDKKLNRGRNFDRSQALIRIKND
jgi:hypothetical protein